MKKGPLSNKEKDYIKKHYQTKSILELSKKMRRSEHMVDKFIKTLDFKVEEKSVDTTENPAATPPTFKGPIAGDLFARKEDRGVTIMTESASMASDESKNTVKSDPKRYRACIHKIKE